MATASEPLRYPRTGEYILIISNTLKFIVALPATDVVSAALGQTRGSRNTSGVQVGKSFGRFRFGGIITSQRDAPFRWITNAEEEVDSHREEVELRKSVTESPYTKSEIPNAPYF